VTRQAGRSPVHIPQVASTQENEMHLPAFKLPERKLLAGVAIGVLVGVVGVGAVSASPAPAAAPSEATATASNIQAVLGVEPGALLRALRNNFRIEVNATGRNATHDILYVRGVITLATGRLTVTLPDNSTQVFTTDSTTVVRDEGKVIAWTDLESGERAMVFGLKNADGSYTARLIRCVGEPVTPPPAAPPTATP
jgi:hypothetical protein